MMKQANTRPAFAAVTAITLLALVGVAIASLATSFALDAKRTSANAESAQLRQLLLAGAASAVDRLNNQPPTTPLTPPAEWDVPLPVSLVEHHTTLTTSVSVAPDGASAIANVNATTSAHTAVQTITLTRNAGRWVVTDAKVE